MGVNEAARVSWAPMEMADLDGDGAHELLLAYGGARASRYSSGERLMVLPGGEYSGYEDLEDHLSVLLIGEQNREFSRLAAVEDIDGDGNADVAALASAWASNGEEFDAWFDDHDTGETDTADPRPEISGAELGPKRVAFNQTVVYAANAWAKQPGRLHVRFWLGVDTDRRDLVERVREAVGEILVQARAECASHGTNLDIFRGGLGQEALGLRACVGETRPGLEALHAGHQGSPLISRPPCARPSPARAAISSTTRS